MSTAPYWPRLPAVNWTRFVDETLGAKSRQIALLVLVLQLIPLAAIPLEISFSLPVIAQSESTSVQALEGTGIAAWVVVESLAILALVKFKQWLPFSLLGTTLTAGVLLHLGTIAAFAVSTGEVLWMKLVGPYAITAGFAIVVFGYLLLHFELEHRMRWWIIHNVLACSLAIGVSIAIGTALTPVIVAALLAVLVVWDIIAVTYTDIMVGLLRSTPSIFVPNFVILPGSWTIDYWALEEFIQGDRPSVPPAVNGALGLGDIVFPSALVLAFAASGELLTGVFVAVGVAGSMMVMTGYQEYLGREMLPALPWVAGGALVGYGSAIAVGVLA